MSDRINHRLGDFEVVRELGRGGMGIVFEARQISLNRRVALKVLSSGLGLTTRAVQRFQREAEAAAKLHHTNIVPVYAIGEQDGTHFYAMELIDGPSLDQVIRQMRVGRASQPASSGRAGKPALQADALAATGPYIAEENNSGSTAGLTSSSLGPGSGYFDTVARMIAEVADALDYAHQQGVIHRDIKPSNLLLSPTGQLSVNDFGLARMLEQPGMTVTGEFVGTPAYMSPEQITAGRIPLDHRTDIYSLGATLYELLAFRPPHTGASREQVLAQIVQKEPKSPRRIRKNVPVDLETICLKCLEKDPDRRYQTANALAEDLRRYVNRFAISARRAGPWTRFKKWARRNPLLTAALVCICILAAAASFFAHQGRRAEQRRLADKEEQERSLLEQRRQTTLDKALLTAMNGDLDEAERAIAQAERQGVSTGQVRLLRGEVAFYRGQIDEAIQHLEQAVELLPVAESAAARGLLAVAYSYGFRHEDFARVLHDLEPIAPVRVEDFLFKGSAISQWNPEGGLRILDEAVKQRPSSAIARIFRSDARINLAMDRADAALADLAVEDAETAKRLLADTSPAALVQCALTYQYAAGVYKFAKLQEKYQRTLALAARDAEALQAFKGLSMAAIVRAYYYWYFGKKDRTIDELRVLAERADKPSIVCMYALISYWRGSPKDLQEVRKMHQRHPNNILLASTYCCAAAELEGRESALQLYHREVQRTAVASRRRFWISIALLLGEDDAGREAGRGDGRRILYFQRNEEAFQKKVLDYLAGVVPVGDLLQAAAGSKHHECEAHFICGLRHLAAGDRTGARKELQAALATPVVNHYSRELSVVFLARMEKDPTWPPWIPVKK